ncbi:hypothetical protein VTK56DRAFT_10025 [Thermocarpiscus australiensis]
MARKKKSAAAKAAQQSITAPNPAAAAKDTDANGLAQAKPAQVAPRVVEEVDTRPETSPYGSPSCTIPFASPLTLPLDILKKSPKLHAAYEGRLPELSAIPEDVGHVLVHYLHTGTYESLKPKPTDTMSKQICELKTSIQAYAAARTYDLPDLMRLAEAKIDKYGEGLPLPALLEVARDAYPTLTEGDDWFLEYLRSRIRPHLKDAKSLIGSNLLDQISGILSPHKVLLRTVLELFCERISTRPEPAHSPLTSPITSPGSSRPVSPLPPTSPMSVLEMRSRSIPREEFPVARKKATPWPSPDNMSVASFSKEASPEPALSETAPLQLEAKPAVSKPEPIPEPTHTILDVVPQPGSADETKTLVEPVVEPSTEPELKIAVEPEIKDAAERKSEVKTAVEPEIKQEEEPLQDTIPVVRRERKDSGKGIELEPAKGLDHVPEHVSELGTESQFKPQVERRTLIDSGFWDTPVEIEPAKEATPSLVELHPVLEPEPAHELDTSVKPEQGSGTDVRDFAGSDGAKPVAEESEAVTEVAPVAPPAKESSSETEVEPEPVPTKSEDEDVKRLADEKPEIVIKVIPSEVRPETPAIKEIEPLPETEKVPKETVESGALEKPEPEAESPKPVFLSDDSQPAGSAQPKTAESGVEPGPKPAEEPQDQSADTDAAIQPATDASTSTDAAKFPAVSSAKPAPEQEDAKAATEPAALQSCSTQVRQRSWKKRFSLRYPVLFGRGM